MEKYCGITSFKTLEILIYLLSMMYVLNSVMSEYPDNLRDSLFKRKRLIIRIEIGNFSKNYYIFINNLKVIQFIFYLKFHLAILIIIRKFL